MTSTETQYDIYGIGAALVDTEIEVTDEDLSTFGIEKGVMTLVDESRQDELTLALQKHLVFSQLAGGGSAANSIYAAACFCSSNFYSCKVANDENGRFYLEDLKKAGVTYHQTNGKSKGVTGKCLVLVTPDAERTMNTFLGVSETLSIEDIDKAALSASRYAYIEGYLVTSETGKPAAIEVCRHAKETNTQVALSLSDPAMAEHFRDGLLEIVGDGVDILFCNAQEALSFTQTTSIEDAIEGLKKHTKTFAITLGADGAQVFDGTTLLHIPGTPVNAVDTNGAGDMFAGAFLHALCDGKDFKAAAKLANISASMVVSQYGPRLSPEKHQALLEQC